MNEFPIISSKTLKLRALEEKDFDLYLKYVNDNDINKQFLFNYDLNDARKRFNEIIEKYKSDEKPYIWVISLKETNEFIGIISLDKISFKNNNFSIACGVLKEFRNKGYGFEATKYLIDYAFKKLKMHRLELGHNIDNFASEKVFEKLGAKFEGIARESKFYDGVYKDRKIYSILDNEWNFIE